MDERNETAEPARKAGKIEAKKLRRAHHAAEARTAIGRGRGGIDQSVLNQEPCRIPVTRRWRPASPIERPTRYHQKSHHLDGIQ
jgi:hypothetical protein